MVQSLQYADVYLSLQQQLILYPAWNLLRDPFSALDGPRLGDLLASLGVGVAGDLACCEEAELQQIADQLKLVKKRMFLRMMEDFRSHK